MNLVQDTLALPDLNGHVGFLYVFEGAVELPGKGLTLQEGDSLIISDEAVQITAPKEADLVLFLLDRQAAYSRAGSMSG